MTKSCLVKSRRRRKILKYLALLAAVLLFTFLFFVYLSLTPRNLPRFLRPLSGLCAKAVYSWQVKSSDPEKRKSGLFSLTNQTGHFYFEPDFYPALRLLINDPDGDVRSWAAWILGHNAVAGTRGTGLNTTEIKIIVMALGMALKNDPDRRVHSSAAYALSLGYWNRTEGAEEAIKYLREVAADESLRGNKAAKMELDSIERFLESEEE